MTINKLYISSLLPYDRRPRHLQHTVIKAYNFAGKLRSCSILIGSMETEKDAIEIGINETLAYMVQCVSSRAFFFLTRTVFTIVIGPIWLGNLLVLASVIKFKTLHRTMYILIGNLAVADLLLGAGLLIVVAYSIYTPLKESQYLCLTQYSLIATSQLASIGNIALMSVERFLAIKYPLKHHVYAQNGKLVKSCIVVSWMTYICIGFLPLLGVNNYSPEIKFPCYLQLIISEVYEIICMLMIIILLIFTLSLSMYVFKTATVKNRQTKRCSKKTQQMLVVFCAHLICWSPFVVTTAILRFKYSGLVRCIKDWVFYLGLTNSAFNWTIYGLLNPKMRQAFGNILCCCKQCKRNTQTSSCSFGTPLDQFLESVERCSECLWNIVFCFLQKCEQLFPVEDRLMS